jgi:dephospho-CoA kinase
MRDQASETQIRDRMSQQWSDHKKRPYADFQVENDEQDLLIPQILEIHHSLTQAH